MAVYGMPYKGSKNKIADWLLGNMPEADVFVDLFGGGGAMAHAAALSGKYKRVIYNEIDDLVYSGFVKAINGGYGKETRWISREDFHKLKNSDFYAAVCFSFGNNLRSYAYSEEIEPWKRALHYARVYGDFSEFEKFGIHTDGTSKDIISHHDEYKTRYIDWYVTNVVADNQSLQSLESLQKLQSLQRLQRLQRLQKLQSLQRLQRLQRLQKLQSLQIMCYNLSYEEVQIPDNAVVYCDIPYKGTDKYKAEFEYDRFYKWVKNQRCRVYISEYNAPKWLTEVASREHVTTMSATNNSKKTTERLFTNHIKEGVKRHDNTD